MMPILIVDDSREDIALATRVLFQCAIRNSVIPIVSGLDCIAYFERHNRNTGALPCLVLLDVAMAPTSGIDVLRILTNSPSADVRDSVFVMLSGNSNYTIVREGYQLGAATFLTKPLECGEFMSTLRSLRRLRLQPTSDGFEILPVDRTKDNGSSHATFEHRP